MQTHPNPQGENTEVWGTNATDSSLRKKSCDFSAEMAFRKREHGGSRI